MQIILPPSFQKSQIPGLPDGITSLPVKYAISQTDKIAILLALVYYAMLG